MRKAARLSATALVAILTLVLCQGCSSEHGHAGSGADPATAAQITARMLVPGTAQGFIVARGPSTAHRYAHAHQFVAPTGAPNQACTELSTAELIRPAGTLDAGEVVNVANPKQYEPLPPSWFEYIDVYPGTEAAGLVKTLAAQVGGCRHFQFTFEGAAGTKPSPATEVAVPMRGLGSEALYVTVRVEVRPDAFLALDFVLIRADRTLIWIVDMQSASRYGNGRDSLTVRLAQDAWRHYRDEGRTR